MFLHSKNLDQGVLCHPLITQLKKENAPVARPKKQPQDLRTKQINVALSPAEIANLQMKADQAKKTVAAFVRASALDTPITIVQSHVPDFEIRNEWRRIGVNLNQLVNGLNEANKTGMTARFPDADEILRVCTELRDRLDDTLMDWMTNEPTRSPKRS